MRQLVALPVLNFSRHVLVGRSPMVLSQADISFRFSPLSSARAANTEPRPAESDRPTASSFSTSKPEKSDKKAPTRANLDELLLNEKTTKLKPGSSLETVLIIGVALCLVTILVALVGGSLKAAPSTSNTTKEREGTGTK